MLVRDKTAAFAELRHLQAVRVLTSAYRSLATKAELLHGMEVSRRLLNVIAGALESWHILSRRINYILRFTGTSKSVEGASDAASTDNQSDTAWPCCSIAAGDVARW